MDILELFDTYNELKAKNLSEKDFEYALYLSLINQRDGESEFRASILEIKREIFKKPEDLDEESAKQWNDFRMRRYYTKVGQKNGFVRFDYMGANPFEKNYIKYYLSIPDEKKYEFFINLSKYCVENEIRGMFKVRPEGNSSDYATVRIYNPEYYQPVLDFIKQYVNKDIPQHPFMPTIDGVGVTIDDGESYNKYITDTLMQYFEKHQSREDISMEGYLNFVMHELEDTPNVSKSVLYNMNLETAIRQSADLGQMTELLADSQKELEQVNIYETDLFLINTKIGQILEKCGVTGYLNNQEEIEYLVNNGVSTVTPERLQSILRTQFERREDFTDETDVLDYLKAQFIKRETNLKNVIESLDKIYEVDGYEGVHEFLSTFKEVCNGTSTRYRMVLEDAYIPYIYVDRYHPKSFTTDYLNLAGEFLRKNDGLAEGWERKGKDYLEDRYNPETRAQLVEIVREKNNPIVAFSSLTEDSKPYEISEYEARTGQDVFGALASISMYEDEANTYARSDLNADSDSIRLTASLRPLYNKADMSEDGKTPQPGAKPLDDLVAFEVTEFKATVGEESVVEDTRQDNISIVPFAEFKEKVESKGYQIEGIESFTEVKAFAEFGNLPIITISKRQAEKSDEIAPVNK